MSCHKADQERVERTSRRIGAKGESKSIGSALGDTLGEVLGLTLPGLGNLPIVEVTSLELLVKSLKRATFHDVDRVNDVTKRLGHLSAVGVSDHGVAVDLLERHLAGKVNTKEDHSGNPEEEDIPSGLK